MKLSELTAHLKKVETSKTGTFSPVFWDVFNCYFGIYLHQSDSVYTSSLEIPEDEASPWLAEITP